MEPGIEQDGIRVLHAFGGRFGFLLAALILLLLSAPLIFEGSAWNLMLDLVAGVVLVAGVHAAVPGRAPILIGLVAAIIDLGIGRVAEASGAQWLMTVQVFLWLATLIFVAATILERVLRSRRVTIHTLQAAICVYLLIGLIWTFFYATIDVLAPLEFRFARGPDFRWTDIPSRRREFMRLFFFSYSTLSTVGGGGIERVGWFTRTAACLEAMTGQIYLAVLIARLVGVHIVQAETPPPAVPTDPTARHDSDLTLN
jgi:hypothetical protein